MKQWCLDHPYLTFALAFWCVTTVTNLLLRVLEVWEKQKDVSAVQPPNQFFIVDPTKLTENSEKETVNTSSEEELN